MADIRLYLVTNIPAAAAIATLYRDPDCLPSWCTLLTDPVEILRIPAGATAHGYFERERGFISAAEGAWIERRERRDFTVGLTGEQFDKMRAWGQRRIAPDEHEGRPSAPKVEAIISHEPRLLSEKWV